MREGIRVMNSRAKFTCNSVKKYASTRWDETGQKPTPGFLFAYEFNAVTDGSAENKKFFASTPGGSLTITAVRDDLFEPGKSYYLDFTEAEVNA
jgi:hypothetical protein